MKTYQTLFRYVSNFFFFLRQLFGYAMTLVWALACPRAVLAGRLLAVESQLAACKDRIQQKKDPRPKFTPAFRLLWVILSMLMERWEDLIHVMQPATVKRWHTRAFRLYWRRKSRPGRPPISNEMQSLIRMLSRENPLWGAELIHGTLLLLGFKPPCEDTIRKYMIKPRKPQNKSMTWPQFLRNHLDVTWAMDFFTVTTLNFSILYVFLIFDHGRRRVMHLAVTPALSMRWVIQQLRESMPYGQQPRYLLRDNDKIYGFGVPSFLEHCGIEEVRTAYLSPWQNPYIERFIGTLRRELLNHVIILNQRHLKRLLKNYIEDYYHIARPH
jgi:putative transposase